MLIYERSDKYAPGYMFLDISSSIYFTIECLKYRPLILNSPKSSDTIENQAKMVNTTSKPFSTSPPPHHANSQNVRINI